MPAYTIKLDGPLTRQSLSGVLGLIVSRIPPDYLKGQRWFASKAREIGKVTLEDSTIIAQDKALFALTLIKVEFKEGAPELYYMPMSLRTGVSRPDDGTAVRPTITLETPDGLFELLEGFDDPLFLEHAIRLIGESSTLNGSNGRFQFEHTTVLSGKDYIRTAAMARRLKGEQSNSSVIYGEDFIMKNFRKITLGVNPDLEVPLFLTTRTGFRNIPLVAGYGTYIGNRGVTGAIASLQTYVNNEGDGWRYILNHLQSLNEYATKGIPKGHSDIPAAVSEFSGDCLGRMHRLGQLTGEMHNALASDRMNNDFAPEPTTYDDVWNWAERIRSYGSEVISLLGARVDSLPPEIREVARRVCSVAGTFWKMTESLVVLAKERVDKIRYHNDYHLGQVLKTGDGFVIIDFEGEPARPLEERRAKHSPLKDVAGMLRSLNYSRYAAIYEKPSSPGDRNVSDLWCGAWEGLARAAFTKGYFETTREAGFLPQSQKEARQVLKVFELDKAVYELNYELNNRPDWAGIPLKYLQGLLA
ncbi:MAG: hypothetical protein AB1597_00620 [Chloroflexota bacterium]